MKPQSYIFSSQVKSKTHALQRELLIALAGNGTAPPMSPENPSADDNTITNLWAPAARIF